VKKLLSIAIIFLVFSSVHSLYLTKITAGKAINPHSEIVHSWTPPSQPGTILLLDDGGEPGQEGKGALDKFGYTYKKVTASEFGSVMLYDYDIIF